MNNSKRPKSSTPLQRTKASSLHLSLNSAIPIRINSSMFSRTNLRIERLSQTYQGLLMNRPCIHKSCLRLLKSNDKTRKNPYIFVNKNVMPYPKSSIEKKFAERNQLKTLFTTTKHQKTKDKLMSKTPTFINPVSTRIQPAIYKIEHKRPLRSCESRKKGTYNLYELVPSRNGQLIHLSVTLKKKDTIYS